LKRMVSIFAALALVLAFTGSAFADSATTTETLNVPNVLTLSGVPTSIDYGDIVASQTWYHATSTFVITYGSLAPATLSVITTDFANDTHTDGIGVHRSLDLIWYESDGVTVSNGPVSDPLTSGVASTIDNVASGEGVASPLTIDASVMLPTLYAGQFTGSMTWTIAAH